MTHSRKRNTIGLLTGPIYRGYGFYVWNGVYQAAQTHGLNLITLVGNRINTNDPDEAQQSVIFDLVNKNTINGLIFLSGMVGHSCTKEELEVFCSQFKDIPIISIPEPIHQATWVAVDNKSGVQQIVSYLIEVKGCRRIAFIRGSEKNVEAEERFNAYKAVLAAQDIAFDPQLVTMGDFVIEGGQRAVQTLLDERKVHFDALVAANDEMAFGALDALQRRGIQVPDDVMVCGFDDTEAAQFSIPSLTTVRQPLHLLGQTAVELLVDHFSGRDIPGQVILPTETVFRQSTRDYSQAIHQAWVDTPSPQSESFLAVWEEKRPFVHRQIAAVIKEGVSAEAAVDPITNQIIDAFNACLQAGVGQPFLDLLSEVAAQHSKSADAVSFWHQVISTLRRHALACGLSGDSLKCAENIWHQARLLIHEFSERNSGHKQFQANEREIKLGIVLNRLITTFQLQRIADIIVKEFPRLDIPFCALALYEDRPGPSEKARLLVAYDENGRFPAEVNDEPFLTTQLLPDALALKRQQYNLIVRPLYFQDEQFGYILFGVAQKPVLSNMFEYESLCQHLNSALKGSQLVTSLQQAQQTAVSANRAKTLFLANMSHEIRTPMNAVIGMSELLAATPLNAEQVDLVETIVKSGNTLLAIINDILDLSKIEAGKLDIEKQPFSLHRCVETMIGILKPKALEKGLKLSYSIDPRVPQFVQGDETRLSQILINLLNNAVKFTPEGEVTLSIQATAVKRHQIQLRCMVKDSGIGIAPEKMDRLFKPFSQVDASTTRKFGGTGLGLMISKKLCKMMGGTMWVESEVNKGSTFTFTILVEAVDEDANHLLSAPSSDQLSAVDVRHHSPATPISDSIRILLADDNVVNQKVALKMLTRLGLQADVAGNGVEVLAALEKRPYDVILMDIQMPEMDGLEAMHRIHGRWPEPERPFIVAMTANALVSDRDFYLSQGMDAYICKPVRLDDLHQVLLQFQQDHMIVEVESLRGQAATK